MTGSPLAAAGHHARDTAPRLLEANGYADRRAGRSADRAAQGDMAFLNSAASHELDSIYRVDAAGLPRGIDAGQHRGPNDGERNGDRILGKDPDP